MPLLFVVLLFSGCQDQGRKDVSFHRPVASPDGTTVAFMSNAGGHWNLYTAGLDGRDLVQVTDSKAFEGYAHFSPDGRQLAFQRLAGDSGQVVIYTLASQESRVLDLGGKRDFAPAWYPDGEHLLFVSERDGNRELYRARADGTAVTRLTDTPMDEHDARVSPDGATIAFVGQDGDQAAVYRMGADGRHRQRLSAVGEGIYGIDWSPDGSSLVFNAAFGGQKDLYRVPAVGGEPERLTDQPGDDHLPIFLPDGRSLLYSAEVDGPERLYRLTLADGRSQPLDGLMRVILQPD